MKIKFKNPLPSIIRWIKQHYIMLLICLGITGIVGGSLYLLHSDINKRTEGKGVEINIPEVVIHHLADSYDWHFATWNDTHLTIHLPVIIRSNATGEWHICTTQTLPEGLRCMRRCLMAPLSVRST